MIVALIYGATIWNYSSSSYWWSQNEHILLPIRAKNIFHMVAPSIKFKAGATPRWSSVKSLKALFRSLKQYSFIWKWDVDIEDVPENVKISSWLPQQVKIIVIPWNKLNFFSKDILSHPNLRVFVTHGGIGGVTEAIYHKANLVGIPFSNDQVQCVRQTSNNRSLSNL